VLHLQAERHFSRQTAHDLAEVAARLIVHSHFQTGRHHVAFSLTANALHVAEQGEAAVCTVSMSSARVERYPLPSVLR
jgi:hypothetical protein